MNFDAAFIKPEKCNWADEVDREFSQADTEEQFSRASRNTWLYYSTTSSLPNEDVLNKRRDAARAKHKSRSKSRRSKPDITEEKSEKTTQRETPSSSKGQTSSRSAMLSMVQMRKKDFDSCAPMHAWVTNFDDREKMHQLSGGAMGDASGKGAVKEKRRNCVSHQVKDGPVLVITRTMKAKPKTPASSKASSQQKQIKNARKLKSLPPMSPTPSRGSRADSSCDWKSDKLTTDTFSLRSFQITPHKKSKRASRFVIGGNGESSKHDRGHRARSSKQ